MPFLGDGEEAEYLIGGPAASWGINSNTKNEEGAEKVLEALASTEVQQAFVDANPGGSTYKEGVKPDFRKNMQMWKMCLKVEELPAVGIDGA